MSKQVLGIDFGDKEVKIVLIADGAVKKALSLELPDNLVAGGVIQSMDAMADFLKTELVKNGLQRKNVAVVLPNSQVYTRTASVPIMTDKQLEYNLPYEFRDYLTEEKSKYYYDYEVYEIEEDEEGKPAGMRLFACAVQKDLIARLREMFHRAGAKLKYAVPEEYAYASLVRRALPEKSAVCFVDLGHQNVRVHMLKNGEYDNKRVLDFGLIDLDLLIADQEGVDVHMAHAYKLSDYHGILESDYAQELYSRITVEILKAVNFYNYNNRDVDLQDIYFIGGGSAIAPLCRAIEDTTGMRAHNAEELFTGAEPASLFARAVGSGLSA